MATKSVAAIASLPMKTTLRTISMVIVATGTLVIAPILLAETQRTGASSLAVSNDKGPIHSTLNVVSVYMMEGFDCTIVTGSAAVLDERFSPLILVEHAEIKDGWLKILCDDADANRKIAIPEDIAQLFVGLKPCPYTTLMPWCGLSPHKDLYWVTALDDGKLCLVLPGENHQFSVPDEKGRLCAVSPLPINGVLAAVSRPILGENCADGMHQNVEGIDINTHKIIWSFPSKNLVLDVGRLAWINSRYLLWTCHARHWEAFEVYDVKKQKIVAKGMQNDRDENKDYVINWRITGNRVLEYYCGSKKPKMVFDGKK